MTTQNDPGKTVVRTYVHRPSDGSQGRVIFVQADGHRYHNTVNQITGTVGKMYLPVWPNTVHGRYFLDQLNSKPMDRRTYRKLHDDYMLESYVHIPDYSTSHGTIELDTYNVYGSIIWADLARSPRRLAAEFYWTGLEGLIQVAEGVREIIEAEPDEVVEVSDPYHDWRFRYDPGAVCVHVEYDYDTEAEHPCWQFASYDSVYCEDHK